MDEEEKKRYEGYASSHVAEERRIYNQYLKLKNRFSGKTPSRERERERAKLPNYELRSVNWNLRN